MIEMCAMRLKIHVTPNAFRDELLGRAEDGKLRIKVQSPPVDGAANKRLVRFLSKTLGVSRSKIRIIDGEKSREKTLEIESDDPAIIRRIEGREK